MAFYFRCQTTEKRTQNATVTLVSAVGNFGADTNRPYWVVVMIGPKPDSIQAHLGYGVASVDTDELCDIIRVRLLLVAYYRDNVEALLR
jgi:hypothetical protein